MLVKYKMLVVGYQLTIGTFSSPVFITQNMLMDEKHK